MQIVTNQQSRHLEALSDLPAAAAKDFDYIAAEEQFEPRFVRYRGEWYDVNETVRCESELLASGWHGYLAQTYFSGVLFRIEGDSVIVGRYYC